MWSLEDFDYHLPEARIAQNPLANRDGSRLLVLDRGEGSVSHREFRDIVGLLQAGDILVANNSRVIPARLFGRKKSGGRVEILLLDLTPTGTWKALVGGKRLQEGMQIDLVDHADRPAGITAAITAELDGPLREITFGSPAETWLDRLGHVPLPPYIHRTLDDAERYQTVFARRSGSAAAPTAGLHFTPEILLALREKGVLLETVTLHIGLDTFKPVEVSRIADHHIHSEWATLSLETAERINQAKLAGGRLIAVGTTTVRTLETAALRSAGLTGSLQTISERDAQGETSGMCPWRPVAAFEGATDLYIYPGYQFRAVDAMITNFHLPQSTLLMMVSAFAGRESILNAYREALDREYRFLSLGDAMFIH